MVPPFNLFNALVTVPVLASIICATLVFQGGIQLLNFWSISVVVISAVTFFLLPCLLYNWHRRVALSLGGVHVKVIDGLVKLRTLEAYLRPLDPSNQKHFLLHLPSLIAASPQLTTIKFDSYLVSTLDHVWPIITPLLHKAITSCPTLKEIHCTLCHPAHVEGLATLISQCTSLENLNIALSIIDVHGADHYFDSIKQAIRHHPNLKALVLRAGAGIGWNPAWCSLDLPQLIFDLQNLESIQFKGLGVAGISLEDIAAVIEAHNKLKIFGIEAEDPALDFYCLDLQHRIINHLALNRALAMLGANPTFRIWVVTLTTFRHYPTVVDYLVGIGIPNGGCVMNVWAQAALDGLNAQSSHPPVHLRTIKKSWEEVCLGSRVWDRNRKQIFSLPPIEKLWASGRTSYPYDPRPIMMKFHPSDNNSNAIEWGEPSNLRTRPTLVPVVPAKQTTFVDTLRTIVAGMFITLVSAVQTLGAASPLSPGAALPFFNY
ncbi:expressed unknown protein [Seminavis robusta]|uniref:Uncharacterized protein n=1 Tax=Seminavis robusta TaxID=568900 RepID=A0A9N8HLF2_9STRA|nr:expressed unknown protein [Seminavis robusta]|eukprot:Sro805_g205000.1 n/a (488) ;mRNA; f:37962-39425